MTVLEAIAELESRGSQVKEQNLATKPKARHWHITKPGEKGVVEVTSDPADGTVQIEVRSNRQGFWTTEEHQRLLQLNLNPD